MTDKKKLHQILSSLWKNDDSVGKTYYSQALQDVQTAIDLQEEPVSDELEKAAEEYIKYTPRYDIGYELEEGNDPTEIDCFTIDEATAAFIEGAKWQKQKDNIPVSDKLEEACEQLAENARKHKAETSSPFFSQTDYKQGVMDGAQWQKEKDESTTEDLGEYINELSKQFPEVSFSKLSRIAVRVAQWQKQQIMKDAVEGEIVKDIANNLYIGKAKVNKNNFKFGDKVKLLVLKEE